ncbi:MAG: Dihydrolipoyllysine-residue succinyltransferase component of 2-oxoglutarate dehydrogenase complex [Phycisphaerae bacterium]|nr:Dihydrolipoyllysine-residue succinyltransferase component of 2-oxoglutarate dehydrogenase complex [Phycisphaerae bacterium]
MPVELKVPEVGESVTAVEIGRWLKREGDVVRKDETVVELETDKATLELPAPADGVLAKVLKEQGESAGVGDVIAHIDENGQAAGPEAPAKKQNTPAVPTKTPTAPTKAASALPPSPSRGEGRGEGSSAAPVMPAARRMMEQRDLQPGDVKGTGPGGRVLKEDVIRHAAAAPAEPAPPPAGRQEQTVRMSLLRRRVADRLVAAQQTAALLTTFNEVDLHAVKSLRAEHGAAFEARHGVKLGFMSFFVKAVIDALRDCPALNAEVRGDSVVYRNYYDIGVAVSSDRGLVVPVLRDAQLMSFAAIEKAVADLSARARSNKIRVEELEGGTFTVTNGGVFGSMLSTPIVNPPQSGILGMHAITDRPVAVAGQVVIRPMMYLALTYDHRIVDGREAVLFLRRVKEVIEQPARMLIEV